ncbi:hypothetical protein [Virgisporangium ochraceum]|uniref:TrbL/VirB6 plasmid conjugal transfer protein n=1 Tax=Virgisporangium ochraceum TaxID=65505 RepID=A0A8J3ZUV0_9ACTN|nr:hypothetical protein [Virgisporangium ochraceum]GIJ70607.1 hypothetical protein Voc01_055240 [Virgisporangium ochraceum]
MGPLDEFFLWIAERCTGALTAAFELIDTGRIEVTPFEGVVGNTTSIGVTLAFLMALVQIGRSLIQVGGGFGRLAIGLVEYTFAVVGGVAILELAMDASDALANELLKAGGADGWPDLPGRLRTPPGATEASTLNEQLRAAVDAGADPGMLALGGVLFDLPAALLYLLMYLALQFVLPLGACVIVIAAAGRLSEFGRAWLPMLARVLGTAALAPLGSALVLLIGIGLQTSTFEAVNAREGGTEKGFEDLVAFVTLFLSGLIILLSPFAFVVIYKMLGFTDRAAGGVSSVQVSTGTSRSDVNAGGTAGIAAAGSTAERRFAGTLASLTRVGGGTLTGGLAAAGGGLSKVAGGGLTRAAGDLTATRSTETDGGSTRSVEPGGTRGPGAGSSGGGSSGGGSGSGGSGWSFISADDVRGSDGASTPISTSRVQQLRDLPQASAPRVPEGVGSGYDHA